MRKESFKIFDTMGDPETLKRDYPWTRIPLVCNEPMYPASGPILAAAVSQGAGLGFLGASNDLSTLSDLMKECAVLLSERPTYQTPDGILPVGIGFGFAADLGRAVQELSRLPIPPAAVWLIPSVNPEDLAPFVVSIRDVTDRKTKIWIEVSTVTSALIAAKHCQPDILVLKGSDAGGYGPVHSASLMALLPEAAVALREIGCGHIPLIAAGGIEGGRGAAAAVVLGASGVCLGTSFLICKEAQTSEGYKNALLKANDGGARTVRTTIYDKLEGEPYWPEGYDARVLVNQSYGDWQDGMDFEENKKLYDEAKRDANDSDEVWAMKTGRLPVYASTAVGQLTGKNRPAGVIVSGTCVKFGDTLGSTFGTFVNRHLQL